MGEPNLDGSCEQGVGGARAERAELSLWYRKGMGKASWKTCSGRKDESEEKGQLAKERGQRRVYLGSSAGLALRLGCMD